MTRVLTQNVHSDAQSFIDECVEISRRHGAVVSDIPKKDYEEAVKAVSSALTRLEKATKKLAAVGSSS